MSADGKGIVRHNYRGGGRIPDDATHVVVVDEDIIAILRQTIVSHQNIVEFICHDKVRTIEEEAFMECQSLRRVVAPGVTEVDGGALSYCEAMQIFDGNSLIFVRERAFIGCTSLSSISLISVRIVEGKAFKSCKALTTVTFSNKLEKLGGEDDLLEGFIFADCTSLEQITIPFRVDLIQSNNIFQGCGNLKTVRLANGVLHETINALYLDDWKNDMNETVDWINFILPDVYAGIDEDDEGEKAWVIKRWMRLIQRKIIHYQAEHRRILDNVATTLQFAFPNNDIVMNNIIPFLELPSYIFERDEEAVHRDRRRRIFRYIDRDEQGRRNILEQLFRLRERLTTNS